MAIHSSMLAWRIPWTKEPGGLQSMGHKELNTAEVTEHAHKHMEGSILLWTLFGDLVK